MDLTLLQWGDAGWGDELARGALMTIVVAACSYVFGIIFGSIFAAAKLSRFWLLRLFGDIYTTVVRGVPELLIIFLVFFGGGTLLHTVANGLFGYEGYIEPPIFLIGVLCISVSAGAYATEVIRAAVLAVPPGQIEAAKSIGMGPWLRLRRVLIPQAARFALPGLGNVWQFTLKDTSLISVVGLVEIMRTKSSVFIPILDDCRNLIRRGRNGQNILRYLLYNMNNVIIKSQFSSGYYSRYYEEWINAGNNYLSGLYLANGCKQFDSLPFNRSPIDHNPKLGAIFDCIPCKDKRPELFARFIRNNTEGKGQLFTDIDELSNFPDYIQLISKYNNSLWSGHRPASDLMIEHNQVFINDYKLDTCKIIEVLQKLAESGIGNYSDDVNIWLLLDDYEIDCNEKKDIISHIFSESRVGVIYGSAGVGKSTLINHVSHYLNDTEKLYLTQTNPAKENLMRKVDADNTTFSTIESFKHQGSPFTNYKLLVIDECSTVSNKDMVEVLQKANFEMLLLVGDTYQIDAIQFGNWFSVLKSFLPESSVFELTQPHRTKDERLLELWDKVRHMDDTAKEVIERESYSLKVDETLLSSLEPGEAILCLNYDGLYGINNINRFLQESNTNPAVTWDIQRYKVGDPILFLDSDRFRPIIYNNMKGILRGVEIIDAGTMEERIQFDVEIQKIVDERDVSGLNLELLEYFEKEEKSLIRFYVHKLKSADEDGEDSSTAVPFQVAYAVSIHKAQGLEYDSVKIVITDEVEELVTHNIFYTAITRAREKLKIYWTPEVEEKVINRIKPRDISKDVELLKNYIADKQQQEEVFDFLL